MGKNREKETKKNFGAPWKGRVQKPGISYQQRGPKIVVQTAGTLKRTPKGKGSGGEKKRPQNGAMGFDKQGEKKGQNSRTEEPNARNSSSKKIRSCLRERRTKTLWG